MATVRTDPLRNFKFRVSIEPTGPLGGYATGLSDLGFAQMSGVSVTNELIPYREGGMNTHPHKMVGQSDFPPVSFARGVFAGQGQLWRWQQFLHTWQGGGAIGLPSGDINGSRTGGTANYRCDIVVRVYDHPVTGSGSLSYNLDPSAGQTEVKQPVKLMIKLFNCWPGSFAMSDLNAGDNGILIQQLQVHHEGFSVDFAPSTTA
jgi:phage tail-like protein